MMRKDYIVRQFEELGKVLGVLLFLKREKDWEKFEEEVAQAALKFTSLEIGHVEDLGEEDFKTEVLDNHALDHARKKILAGLLFEKLDYYGITGQPEKEQNIAAKCLALYTHLHSNQTQNEFDMEVHYRLEFLRRL